MIGDGKVGGWLIYDRVWVGGSGGGFHSFLILFSVVFCPVVKCFVMAGT